MCDLLDFTGKTVLVVGGSSGIGNGIAQGFQRQGADVHVTGTRGSAADYDGVEDSNLEGLTFHSLDVADRGAVERRDWPERLDVVVLCQGIVRYAREEYEQQGWDDVIEINLSSLMDCARAFRSRLAAQHGSLIIVSSVGAYHAIVGNPAYAASKAGAASLVKSLAAAWARDNIRVNGIAPGIVPTKLTTVTTENEKRRDAALRQIPVGRLGAPEDMAGAALYLASPLASYVAGHTIAVDGGYIL